MYTPFVEAGASMHDDGTRALLDRRRAVLAAAAQLVGVDAAPLRLLVQHFAPESAAGLLISVRPGAQRLAAAVGVADPGALQRVQHLLCDALGLDVSLPDAAASMELRLECSSRGLAMVELSWAAGCWRWDGAPQRFDVHPLAPRELAEPLGHVVRALGEPQLMVGQPGLLLTWSDVGAPDVIRIVATTSPGTRVGGLLGGLMRTVEPAEETVARFTLEWLGGEPGFVIGVRSGALPAVGEA